MRTGSPWRRCPVVIPDTIRRFDLAESYLTERPRSETLGDLEAKRVAHEKQALVDWLDQDDPLPRYVLIRARHYDLFAALFAGRAIPMFRETGMKRNELVLLEVNRASPLDATASRESSAKR